MTELIEGDLAFYFDETYLQAYRFDDDVQLGKVNLKRVDFIAEKADKIFFYRS